MVLDDEIVRVILLVVGSAPSEDDVDGVGRDDVDTTVLIVLDVSREEVLGTVSWVSTENDCVDVGFAGTCEVEVTSEACFTPSTTPTQK